MRVLIHSIGQIVTGDLASPLADGSEILLDDGRVAAVGSVGTEAASSADVVIDAGGSTAIPGLIDSHVHITFGDYTPRQRTVGFLESYVHGGVTTSITASEVHVPGRPSDPVGVKALAIAAQRCFATWRPSGMQVYAGSVILEPGLVEADFAELAAAGVWLAKAGFGAVETPYDYVPMIQMAKAHGMVTNVHTGGASIPGSSPIHGDHLLAMDPDVSFHVNGGPIAMPDADFERLVVEGRMALQLCTAGNLRTALLCVAMAEKHDALDRVLIATDTPTGSGIMPLGILYTITHVSALGGIAPESAIAMATGNNAAAYRLDKGILAPGRAGDVLLVDAPLGGSQTTALDAIRHGDIPAIGAVITDGQPRIVGASRNTPPTTRKVRVESGHASLNLLAGW